MSNVTTEYVGAKASNSSKQNYRWWAEEANTMYQSVWEVVNRIENQNSFQHGLNIKHARLYSDLELLGFASYRLSTSNRNNNLTITKKLWQNKYSN